MAQFVEMFGEVCKLQKLSFFSIGHSFAALAFIVSEPKILADGNALVLSVPGASPLGHSICIA